MKSISASIIVLAAAELIRTNSDIFGLAGIVIGIIGLVGWASTFLSAGEQPQK